jgi:SAM-dependent methyltransferase
MESRNSSGMPLASAEWLEAHHQAKLPERRAFAQTLAARRPQRVIDLGCGTGLWLALLDEVLPADCELVGFDADGEVLDIARNRNWTRPMKFERLDIESDSDSIPVSDMTLAFNIFSYLKNPAKLLSTIARNGGTLVVRQYDGGAVRFGPMDIRLRSSIESSLRASVISSDQFSHYDMDRVFKFLLNSQFSRREVGFELFARSFPFPEAFLAYYESMLTWTLDLLSEGSADALRSWLPDSQDGDEGRYFFEVDLVAVLS